MYLFISKKYSLNRQHSKKILSLLPIDTPQYFHVLSFEL